MSLRTVLIVLLALTFGVSAVFVVQNLRPEAPPSVSPEVVQVVVAATEIPRGRTISGDALKLLDWPKDRVPKGALTKVEDAYDRVCMSPVGENEPVLDSRLSPRGAGRGMAAMIPRGMRAFTIQTPNVSTGVAGFILPGNKVDVFLTVSGLGDEKTTGGAQTSMLLQNIEILAVDNRVDAPADNKVNPNDMRSITLLVTPQQAASLTLGQTKGSLTLSLRNPEDETGSKTKPTTLSDISEVERPKEEPKKEQPSILKPLIGSLQEREPEPEATIRTLRGVHEGEVKLKTPPAPR